MKKSFFIGPYTLTGNHEMLISIQYFSVQEKGLVESGPSDTLSSWAH